MSAAYEVVVAGASAGEVATTGATWAELADESQSKLAGEVIV
ncbi:hypothetical protein [Adhaeretor mobilis]|uniref:Uncharacterized protein n=1 Tax=Adhaeretor mobilis TaxID=1930276 RepID=A0A517N2P4_9BACT|nr:hypothetical protein [Adhaeretor mobilis]QDT01268.1 hypothetical protein HG15A2_46100 [Adhaeretor mobilis]